MAVARSKGAQVISGLEMFVQQGARQFEIWTGKPAPVAEMAYVVTKALERRAVETVEEPPAKPVAKNGRTGNDHAKHDGSKRSVKAASRSTPKKAVKKLTRK
jgi:3-dehydroquinate dehydratase/shikimate dehydrogenase